LEALARALKLDDAERSHLFNLTRALRTANPTRRRAPKPRVRASVQQVLDAMTGAPAYVRNEYGDLVFVLLVLIWWMYGGVVSPHARLWL
jgi:hypothetical protein